jgi:hypothetical protein
MKCLTPIITEGIDIDHHLHRLITPTNIISNSKQNSSRDNNNSNNTNNSNTDSTSLEKKIQIYEQAEPQTSNEPLSTTAEQVTEVKSHNMNLKLAVHSIILF